MPGRRSVARVTEDEVLVHHRPHSTTRSTSRARRSGRRWTTSTVSPRNSGARLRLSSWARRRWYARKPSAQDSRMLLRRRTPRATHGSIQRWRLRTRADRRRRMRSRPSASLRSSGRDCWTASTHVPLRRSSSSSRTSSCAARRSRDILLVGAAFGAGVFLAYFLAGLGLYKYVAQAKWFFAIARWFYLAIGVFALIIAMLSHSVTHIACVTAGSKT